MRTPFASFQGLVVEYARKPEKDYQAFIPFEDGTVLVYTGVFDVQAPATEEPWRHRLRVRAAARRHRRGERGAHRGQGCLDVAR